MAPKFRLIGSRHILRDQVKCFIIMVITLKAIIICPKSKERVCIYGRILSIRVTSKRIRWRVMQELNFHRTNFMMVVSKMARDMAMDCINIPMVINTQDNGKMMRKLLVYILSEKEVPFKGGLRKIK